MNKNSLVVYLVLVGCLFVKFCDSDGDLAENKSLIRLNVTSLNFNLTFIWNSSNSEAEEITDAPNDEGVDTTDLSNSEGEETTNLVPNISVEEESSNSSHIIKKGEESSTNSLSEGEESSTEVYDIAVGEESDEDFHDATEIFDLNTEPTTLVEETTTNSIENSTSSSDTQKTTTVAPSRSPCKCRKGTCSCCSGRILQFFNRRACVKLRYLPEDFAFEIRMVMNNRTLYENIVSGKNPRPMCARVPFLQVVSFCAEFYEIFFVGRNMNICLDMTGNLNSNALFRISFKCLRFGANGVRITDPDDGVDSNYGYGGVDAIIDQADSSEYEEYNEIV